MMSTTGLVGLFIQMEITTSEIGWMEKEVAMENQLINKVKCMKDSGNTVNTWALDILKHEIK